MDRVRGTDQFFVYSKSNIGATDYQSLALLYQPIIGVLAFSLYSVLWSLMNRQTLQSERHLHSDLESLLNVKLAKLEEARRNLEAIGLLRAFFHDDCFAYEMKIPMAPASFINDGVLGSYLQNLVGEKRYDKILKIFSLAPVVRDGFVEVTKPFNEVFPALGGEDPKAVDGEFIAPNRAKKVKVDESAFDFRLFVESFPEGEKVKGLLTDLIREKILRLSYVYGLDESAMHTVFARASEEDYSDVDLARLSRFARDEYRKGQSPASTIPAKEETPVDVRPTDPQAYFATLTPKQLLVDLSGGLVSDADLRIVERLIDEIGLDKGVVNVLLYYVLKINDKNMPPWAYFQKIGMSWKRNGIGDVPTAMEYVRHLNAEYRKSQDPAAARKEARPGKGSKPDIHVDWLEEYLQSAK